MVCCKTQFYTVVISGGSVISGGVISGGIICVLLHDS